MKKTNIYLVVLLIVNFISCKSTLVSNREENSTDSVKTVKVVAQMRPFGEPSYHDMPIDKGLETLQTVSKEEVELDSTDLILGLINDGEPYAIPIKYLSGFEVANLYLGSNNSLLTWCPIVGSARWFEGSDSLDVEGFDFGRGLINNNLLIIDRKTNSVWNQLSCKAVVGDRKGEQLSPLPSIQSNWAFWIKKYPNTKLIINTDTSNAVFPQYVMETPIYSGWSPGKKYEPPVKHAITELGLAISLGESAVFFRLEKLFKQASPVSYELEGMEILIHSDEKGLTAWAEDQQGKIIPGTLVYRWAWKHFYPRSEYY